MEFIIIREGRMDEPIGRVSIPDEIYANFVYNNPDIVLGAIQEYDDMLEEYNVIGFNLVNDYTTKLRVEEKAKELFEKWKKETATEFQV